MDLFINRKEILEMKGFILLAVILTAFFFSFKGGLINEYQLEPTATVDPTPTIITSPTSVILKGVASFYDRSVCVGREYGVNCKTASGEIFNDEELTFASLNLDFGTEIEFGFNGKSVVCKCNDRGPYIQGRMFDLSKACADAIGMTGVKEVEYKINAE